MIHLMSGRHHFSGWNTFPRDIDTRGSDYYGNSIGASDHVRNNWSVADKEICVPSVVHVTSGGYENEYLQGSLNCDRNLRSVKICHRAVDKGRSQLNTNISYQHMKDILGCEKYKEYEEMYILQGHRNLKIDNFKRKYTFNGSLYPTSFSRNEMKNYYLNGEMAKKSGSFESGKDKMYQKRQRILNYENRHDDASHRSGNIHRRPDNFSHSCSDLDHNGIGDSGSIHELDLSISSSLRDGRPDIARSQSLQVKDNCHHRGFMRYCRCHSYSPGKV